MTEVVDLEQGAANLAWILEAEAHTWAIRPELLAAMSQLRHDGESLAALQDVALNYYGGAAAEGAEIEAARRSRVITAPGGVAVIPLKGVLTPSVSLLALLFGMGSGLSSFRESLKQAVADPDIGKIVLDIDSPGGLVDLIPETAQEVRKARNEKPVIAVANTMAASAAYWIASQADEVVVTPSGEVGSIGVYSEHRDISGALEQAGVKPTLISAGKYKVEGNPYEPLDDTAREALQQDVNDYYSLFTRDVAAGRGVQASVVKSGYGEGRCLPAKRAVSEGLADRVDTLEASVARAASNRTQTRRANVEVNLDGPEIADAVRDEVAGDVTYSAEELHRVFDTLAALQR